MEQQAVQVVNPGEQSVAASLGLEPRLFLFQLVNVIIVFLILWFLILKPLTKKMEERRAVIDESLDNAKKIETELHLAEQKAQRIVDEAKVEANAAIQRGIVEADAAAAKHQTKAKQEIEGLIAQAKRSIEHEKLLLRIDLRKETVTLVLTIVQKFLAKKLDKKADEAFVKEILEKDEKL